MKKILAMLLLGFTTTSYGVVNINWAASGGFYFNADPYVGILGDGTGNSTRAQLMYSPDATQDAGNVGTGIGLDGAGLDNDVILASVTITEDGVPGNMDDYACFAENYTGPFTAGYVYTLIFQDNVYGGNDWYYYTPMVPLQDITSGFPQIIEMNTDRMYGDAIDFGPNVCQKLAPSLKELTVNGGTGGGSYANEEQVEISADAPVTGKAFSRWIGDTQYVASVTSTTTTVTMPAQDIALTATYVDIYYTLTVNSGSGSGSYTNGTRITIEFNPIIMQIWPRPEITFITWTGAVQYVANVASPTTTVTMPAANITVTAIYTVFQPPLPDDDSDGDGMKDWEEYIAGTNPSNSASSFRVTENSRNVLGWNAVSGRVYSVYWTTNLLTGFQCLESNIPWTQGSFTNSTDVPCGYYKIGVRLEN